MYSFLGVMQGEKAGGREGTCSLYWFITQWPKGWPGASLKPEASDLPHGYRHTSMFGHEQGAGLEMEQPVPNRMPSTDGSFTRFAILLAPRCNYFKQNIIGTKR